MAGITQVQRPFGGNKARGKIVKFKHKSTRNSLAIVHTHTHTHTHTPMRPTKNADLIGHIEFLPWRQLYGCSVTRLWNEHYSLGLFVLPIVILIHLFTSVISAYVAFTFLMSFDHTIFGSRQFCINTSFVVLIGFCQSDEYLPKVKLSIILHPRAAALEGQEPQQEH